MKKILTLFILIIATANLYSQEGEIIYRDFEPDSTLQFWEQPSSMFIDVDEDGTYDIRLYWYFHSVEGGFDIIGHGGNVTFCKAEEGDTIPNLTGWWFEITFPENNEKYAIRIKKDGEYYYGWFRSYLIREPGVFDIYCFDKFAFCTIPNYPLRWGQTELLDVEETENIEFANVQPNPTNGIITVTGEKLRQIEVFDTLGQMITTLQAGSDQTTIDLGGQPAGIYLINVTSQDGKHCVKKVVKQ